MLWPSVNGNMRLCQSCRCCHSVGTKLVYTQIYKGSFSSFNCINYSAANSLRVIEKVFRCSPCVNDQMSSHLFHSTSCTPPYKVSKILFIAHSLTQNNNNFVCKDEVRPTTLSARSLSPTGNKLIAFGGGLDRIALTRSLKVWHTNWCLPLSTFREYRSGCVLSDKPMSKL